MRKFKRLNRKGFTLIELLAVIVILAVIMVIASTSVLTSMNESKKKSLLNSAQSAASAFETAYSETILTSSTTILGVSSSTLMVGTKAAPAKVALNTNGVDLASLNINNKDYDLAGSFVSYNGAKFTVCFMATSTGNFYVASAVSKKDKTYGVNEGITANTKLVANKMWACSNGYTSWTEGQA